MNISSELLHEIAHCSNVVDCLQSGDGNHECFEIVRYQAVKDFSEFQVPEPWSGQIETAPILFISSNPSINSEEEFPLAHWSPELIEDFFFNRFGGGKKSWNIEGDRALAKDGSYLTRTKTWTELRNRASELLGRPAVPGENYALTDIVHCKTPDRIGVKSALNECSSRYLHRILQFSGASIVAVVGKDAGDFLRDKLSVPVYRDLLGPNHLFGRKRVVLFLAAPGSSEVRMIPKVFSESKIDLIRSLLYEDGDAQQLVASDGYTFA